MKMTDVFDSIRFAGSKQNRETNDIHAFAALYETIILEPPVIGSAQDAPLILTLPQLLDGCVFNSSGFNTPFKEQLLQCLRNGLCKIGIYHTRGSAPFFSNADEYLLKYLFSYKENMEKPNQKIYRNYNYSSKPHMTNALRQMDADDALCRAEYEDYCWYAKQICSKLKDPSAAVDIPGISGLALEFRMLLELVEEIRQIETELHRNGQTIYEIIPQNPSPAYPDFVAAHMQAVYADQERFSELFRINGTAVSQTDIQKLLSSGDRSTFEDGLSKLLDSSQQTADHPFASIISELTDLLYNKYSMLAFSGSTNIELHTKQIRLSQAQFQIISGMLQEGSLVIRYDDTEMLSKRKENQNRIRNEMTLGEAVDLRSRIAHRAKERHESWTDAVTAVTVRDHTAAIEYQKDQHSFRVTDDTTFETCDRDAAFLRHIAQHSLKDAVQQDIVTLMIQDSFIGGGV